MLPDLIAVGYLADMDPVELLNRISDDPRTSQTPLLYLSANSDLDEVQRAYNAGADDTCSRPTTRWCSRRRCKACWPRPDLAAACNKRSQLMARLGDILVRNGWITPGQLQSALAAQGSERGMLGVHPRAPRADHDGSARRSAGRAVRRAVHRSRAEGMNPQVVRLLPEELARSRRACR